MPGLRTYAATAHIMLILMSTVASYSENARPSLMECPPTHVDCYSTTCECPPWTGKDIDPYCPDDDIVDDEWACEDCQCLEDTEDNRRHKQWLLDYVMKQREERKKKEEEEAQAQAQG